MKKYVASTSRKVPESPLPPPRMAHYPHIYLLYCKWKYTPVNHEWYRQVQYKNKSCKHLRNYEQIFKLKLTCYQYHIYIFNIYDIDRHYGPFE